MQAHTCSSVNAAPDARRAAIVSSAESGTPSDGRRASAGTVRLGRRPDALLLAATAAAAPAGGAPAGWLSLEMEWRRPTMPPPLVLLCGESASRETERRRPPPPPPAAAAAAAALAFSLVLSSSDIASEMLTWSTRM